MKEYIKSLSHTTFKRYCKVLKLQNDHELIRKYKEVHNGSCGKKEKRVKN